MNIFHKFECSRIYIASNAYNNDAMRTINVSKDIVYRVNILLCIVCKITNLRHNKNIDVMVLGLPP